jgi:hypothetical protein
MAVAASLLVVAVAVVYLVAPTTEALAISLNSHVTISKNHEVVYGKVLNSASKPIAGAIINVDGAKSVKTSGRGIFREVLSLTPGTYSIGCQANVGGHHLSASTNANLRYGHAYHLSCRVTLHNFLYIFPVGSY